MNPSTEKILLIRLSSLGDVTQTLSVAAKLGAIGEVHWVVREDLRTLVEGHPNVKKIWSFNRREGALGLWRLFLDLRRENYSRVYDAHNSLRSRLLSLGLWLTRPSTQVLRKPRYAWKRFLLFRFRKNTFPQPFSGQRELLRPLLPWGLSEDLPPAPQFFVSPAETAKARALLKPRSDRPRVAVAASAAHVLKRWPLDHWQKLIEAIPTVDWILLGGPEDHFLKELQVSQQVQNFAGFLTPKESGAVLAECDLLVSNDTGLLHIAEQLGLPAIALMGPAPFGFPSRKSTLILERNLPCRPCSKHGQGPCINPNFHECLRSITPGEVLRHVEDHLSKLSASPRAPLA